MLKSFQKITRLDFSIDPVEYVKGKGRFMAFENLPSTLRELMSLEAVKGISKLGQSPEARLYCIYIYVCLYIYIHIYIYIDDTDRKGAKKFYAAFAKMLDSLVNLEALRLYHFPDGNVESCLFLAPGKQ
jgi:hypothetical protein